MKQEKKMILFFCLFTEGPSLPPAENQGFLEIAARGLVAWKTSGINSAESLMWLPYTKVTSIHILQFILHTHADQRLYKHTQGIITIWMAVWNKTHKVWFP